MRRLLGFFMWSVELFFIPITPSLTVGGIKDCNLVFSESVQELLWYFDCQVILLESFEKLFS